MASALRQALSGQVFGAQSLASRLGFGQRDAIEDYLSVLQSLKLQAKQVGFLFGVKHLFPRFDWHDVLGCVQLDNRSLKNQLFQLLAQIRGVHENIPEIQSVFESAENEIRNVPDVSKRELSALQLAEALRLFVENSKPGGFSGTWNATFGANRSASITPQIFLDTWWHYICSYESRTAFILNVARSVDAFNASHWVGYFLREYEYCLSQRNAHRNSRYQIEHFFASKWGEKNPGMLQGCGFGGVEEYNSSFVEQIGNKLVLDEKLNQSLKDQDLPVRVNAYQSQSYSSITVAAQDRSESAIEIGQQLVGKGCGASRVFVQLRSLRLAVFAARRF